VKATPPPLPVVSRSVLEFRGSGREYFGIWIVNLVLTIITLGIYFPWARVRTRRYFYRNTLLDGHSFDYLADPKRLLIGYLIVGAFFVLYSISDIIHPFVALGVVGLFGAVFPWLRYKSARFLAANSAYRNIRFRFNGSLGGSYAAYLGWPLLAILTLGLLGPFIVFQQKKYFFDNFSLGSFRSEFRGRPGFFFVVLYALGFVVLVLSCVLIAGVAAIAGLMRTSSESATSTTTAEELPGEIGLVIAMVPLAFNLILLILFGVWAVLSRNYCWNNVVLNPGPNEVRFESRLRIGHYLWIFISNIVLIIVTFGLFVPWASVRMFRYRTSCLSLHGATSLDELVAEISAEPNAVGDAASDLFDFDFGL
jgi:uncharacterized membrane protein YjgN (DUF898 family)